MDEYVCELIPQQHRWKLEQVLDWDNKCDRDLLEIAERITQWEVKLAGPLSLTPEEIDDINVLPGAPVLKRCGKLAEQLGSWLASLLASKLASWLSACSLTRLALVYTWFELVY